MNHHPLYDIRIGTLIKGDDPNIHHTAAHLASLGFESLSITFWKTCQNIDLGKLHHDVTTALLGTSTTISSLGIYGNPLEHHDEAEICRKSWRDLIERAPSFGCHIVAGFAGCLSGKPVPDSLPRYREIFSELNALAESKGVKLAFENCPMGGSWQNATWNIAYNPSAWELMFQAIPTPNIGLQWEPCHQILQHIDPLPQLDAWKDRIFILHGKDATVLRDRLARYGDLSPEKWGFHRHPGFGDTNWTDLISRLRLNGFRGAIDIEGWHDPVYKGDLEMTGQVHALHYLKQCRGGSTVV